MVQDFAMTALLEEEDVADEQLERPIHTQGPPPFFPEPPDDTGDDDRHGDNEPPPEPPLRQARLAMLIVLGAEAMFFASLIGAFLVYRLSHVQWAPAALPRLPVGITGLNTLVLLASAYTMWQANRHVRAGEQRRLVQRLRWTTLLGAVFLTVQGSEWLRLMQGGLTVSSGMYGATFYTLIGCHALHVLGAVLWLVAVLWRAWRQRYTSTQYVGVALCGMCWYFIVALWPVLYGLVYLL